MVQYVISNTFHTALKATPSKLLLGYNQRNHSDYKLIDFLNNLAISLNYDVIRNESRNLALDTVQKIKNYNKIYFDKRHRKPTLYNSGDYVMIRDSVLKPDENKKLEPNYKGPYLVAKVLNISSRLYNSILSPNKL